MIFILNNFEEIIGTLNNDVPDGCPYYDDKFVPVLGSAYVKYQFSTPLDHPSGMSATIKEDGYIVRKDQDGRLIQFQIAQIDDDHEFGMTRTVYCELVSIELTGKRIRPNKWFDVNGRAALESTLMGTRWIVDRVDWSGTATFEITEYKTALAMVHEIAEKFGCELVFRVEFQNNKVSRRIVDLVLKRGKSVGARFDIDHSIEGIKRTIDRRDVVTSLIGLGKGDQDGKRITFTNVEWSKVAGDPADKPIGQDWIGDPEALKQWGLDYNGERIHLESTYESETQDAAVLLRETWNDLQRRKVGFVTYEMDARLLGENIGIGHEDIRIGDTVIISDTEIKPPILVEARVIEMEVSFTDPDASTIKLGNYVPIYSSTNKILSRVQNQLIQNAGVWSSGERVTKGPTAPEDPEANQLWIDTSDPNLDVWKRWDDINAVWKDVTTTTPQQIGAETPQGAQTKANTAEQNAKDYTDTKLVDYVDAVTYNQNMADIQNQIDGNITSWFYGVDPTTSNEPANTWLTDTDKNNHLGDLYYNTNSGYAWRWANQSGVFKWISVKDTDVTKALQDAATAQDTADSKRRVFVSQPIPPYDAGDLWTSGQTVYRCLTAKTTGGTYSAGDWQKVGDVTSQNTAADTTNVGGTAAGTVRDNAGSGKSAKDKLDTEVGSNVIETTAGSAAKANTAEGNAKAYAEPLVSSGGTAPTATKVGQKWIDTSVSGLEVWKKWTGSSWVEIGRVNLNQMSGAVSSDQIGPGSVTEQKLADLAVTLNKIGTGAVGSDKLGVGSVVNDKLADLTITLGKLGAGSVSAAKMVNQTITATQVANDTLTGSQVAATTIAAGEIVNNTLTAAQVANATLTGTQIATTGTITGAMVAGTTIGAGNIVNATLTATQIANTTITGGKVAGTTLTGSNLVNQTLTGTQVAATTIAAGNIVGRTLTAAQIALLAITSGEVANATLTGSQIATTGTITGSHVAGTTISSGNIIDGTLTATQLANLAVTGTKMAAKTIASGNLIDLTLTAAQIANATLTGTQISATGTLLGTHIAATTIGAGNIVNSTITGGKIAGTTISSGNIVNNTLTATQLANNTITAGQIAANTITGSQIAANTITNSQIANNTITSALIATTGLDASVLNVEIGGKNLLLKSDIPVTNSSYPIQTYTMTEKMADGETYTLRLKGTLGAGKSRFGAWLDGGSISLGSLIDQGDGTFLLTFTGKVGTLTPSVLYIYPIPSSTVVNSTIEWIKLEKGNKFTDYTKAPEDPIDTVTQIVDRTIAAGKVIASTLTANEVANSTLTGSQIATTGTITGSHVAGTTIGAGNIVNSTITGGKIAGTTISSGNIVNNTLTATQVANNTITATQIAANTITSNNILANTIVAADIAASTITGSLIAATTIAAGNLVENTITAGQIAADTITGSQIAALTIAAGEIVANTITAGQIAANTITSTNILANTILAADIAADTITGSQIAARTIAAGEIVSLTLTANEVAANTITGGKIAANTITGSNIAADTITAANIASKTITADEINVTMLSALATDFGTMTAGTINGVTINGSTFNSEFVSPNNSAKRGSMQLDVDSLTFLDGYSPGDTTTYTDYKFNNTYNTYGIDYRYEKPGIGYKTFKIDDNGLLYTGSGNAMFGNFSLKKDPNTGITALWADGALKLQSDVGISLEKNTSVTGKLTVSNGAEFRAGSGAFAIKDISGNDSGAWWDNDVNAGWSYWGSAWFTYNYTNARFEAHDFAGSGWRKIAASGWDTISTEKSKKDIEELSVLALPKIQKTIVKKYKYKDDETNTDRIGLIAEEAPTEILTNDGKAIEMYSMISLLWKAVQELTEKVEMMKTTKE